MSVISAGPREGLNTANRQTLVQKILARASAAVPGNSGGASVQPGEIVTCAVDLAMMHDSGGPRRVDAKLRGLGVGVWDVSKVVVVSDHYVPAVDADSAQILQFTRGWVAEHGIKHFYDMRGICHVVLAEGGHVRPGMFAVGGDSHSPTGGAWGAFMVGIGATEMAGVLATGTLWVKVPQTLRVRLYGRLGAAVSAKDLQLSLLAQLGMNNDYQVIEFAGPAIAQLSMQERMTLCNMAAELGCKTGIVAPDAHTIAALRAAGVADAQLDTTLCSDTGADFSQDLALDLAELTPMVALPHSPANSFPVTQVAPEHANVRLDQCYLGACTGAKLEDLQMAALVLRGRKVASSTRLLIAPASVKMLQQASLDGTLAILLDAGAILLPSGCGACAGLGAGVLAPGETCIASTARNFKGRMGAPDSVVYLGSPYTVAASAVRGRLADPREFFGQCDQGL
jgi:3-isopropylmalate/(R)-2-methylmalate dehydratase large subunit